jgi:hypothetical protein
VAFVVDTNGLVDRSTLRVIESPSGAETEQEFHSHIYVVAARVRQARGRIDPAGDGSMLRHEVASHVAELVFRPALKQGRTVRSSVLIACEASGSG